MSDVHKDFDDSKKTSKSLLDAFFDKFSNEQLAALNAKRKLDTRFQKLPDVHLTPEITLSLTTDRLGERNAQTIYRMTGENLLEKGNAAFANEVAKRMGIDIEPARVKDGMAFVADIASVMMALQRHPYTLRLSENGIPIATFNNYMPAQNAVPGHQPE